MKTTSFLFGLVLAVAVICVLLLTFGVSFRGAGPVKYNAATETKITGVVEDVEDFACPVSDGEMGSHLRIRTQSGTVQVHLAPARIMRAHDIKFAPGDKVEVIGSKVRYKGADDVIAREVTRGTDFYLLRDQSGKLTLVQY
jgi:DNA/RNA endonuclease YhcR with UshA esterase domain